MKAIVPSLSLGLILLTYNVVTAEGEGNVHIKISEPYSFGNVNCFTATITTDFDDELEFEAWALLKTNYGRQYEKTWEYYNVFTANVPKNMTICDSDNFLLYTVSLKE